MFVSPLESTTFYFAPCLFGIFEKLVTLVLVLQNQSCLIPDPNFDLNVGSWLEEINLGSYRQIFKEN